MVSIRAFKRSRAFRSWQIQCDVIIINSDSIIYCDILNGMHEVIYPPYMYMHACTEYVIQFKLAL